jgi:hypothetical protein
LLQRRCQYLRMKLVLSMVAVVFLLTAAMLALVQLRMRRHVQEDLVSTLHAEALVHSEIERGRREQKQLSAAVIARQPIVKALMSTNDQLTVQDGSEAILQTNQGDLLILENAGGVTLGFSSTAGGVPLATVRRLLQDSAGEQDWWLAGERLYQVTFAVIEAGPGSNRQMLGRVARGREVSLKSVLGAGIGKGSVAMERDGMVILSSLPRNLWSELESSLLRDNRPAGSVDIFLTKHLSSPGRPARGRRSP